jgi:hypothetical protein
MLAAYILHRNQFQTLHNRLTELEDGQILSMTCWHTLADAGRGISFMARLSEYYRRVLVL